ncbi:TIGR04100 family radical SAM protein [Fervidicella metallireducens]|uniref:TIGR04100 family radical SAM protein n=1 Tax=Fervidicella metallireducens TaxID=655338 RepID=UPI0005500243
MLDHKGTRFYGLNYKCPCDCVFCVRKNYDSLTTEGSLWLEHEPELSEIINELKKRDLSKYDEAVFCGYGEPLVRIDTLIEVCKYIRSVSSIKIRINTNGLSDLIHQKPTAHLLSGLVDSISISLNAPSADEYLKITNPEFGIESFQSLLNFAQASKKVIGDVYFSVVDILTEEQILRCKEISERMNIPLKIRHKA